MRLFPKPLEIDDHEGFSKNDIFGRVGLGKGLTNLVSSVVDPTVIAVDGQWGSGKTAFLKMWAGELRNAGFPTIYFDAFAHDYAEDAFTAIAGEIISLAEAKQKANDPAAKKFLNKAVGAGKILLRSGLKLGVKAATLGALEAADFEEVATDLSKESSELVDKYLGDLLTKQKQQKDAFQSFRDALSELPALLDSTKSKAEGSAEPKKPLIFIIDELDRCRPLFALEVLERIKHFFSVPHVHFVLGTHLTQLQNSVIVDYGSNIDARVYLQNFIHLTMHLVDGARHPHERINIKFIDHLIASMEFKAADQNYIETAKALIAHVAENRNLSLRQVERIISVLAISLAYRPDNFICPAPLLVGLCILKATEPELYAIAKSGRLTFEKSREALGVGVDASKTIARILDYWRYFTDPGLDISKPPYQNFSQGLVSYDVEREDVLRLVANAVVDRLSQT